ncbi:MAG: hypothetical protein K2Q01_09815, partial [Rickettsiales bacterium]|nr:hypothetical protein [Rickettsiales bacterium]
MKEAETRILSQVISNQISTYPGTGGTIMRTLAGRLGGVQNVANIVAPVIMQDDFKSLDTAGKQRRLSSALGGSTEANGIAYALAYVLEGRDPASAGNLINGGLDAPLVAGVTPRQIGNAALDTPVVAGITPRTAGTAVVVTAVETYNAPLPFTDVAPRDVVNGVGHGLNQAGNGIRDAWNWVTK